MLLPMLLYCYTLATDVTDLVDLQSLSRIKACEARRYYEYLSMIGLLLLEPCVCADLPVEAGS